ncbi:hypothetical protein E2I00_000372, partial [Balaenoptera physalus]
RQKSANSGGRLNRGCEQTWGMNPRTRTGAFRGCTAVSSCLCLCAWPLPCPSLVSPFLVPHGPSVSYQDHAPLGASEPGSGSGSLHDHRICPPALGGSLPEEMPPPHLLLPIPPGAVTLGDSEDTPRPRPCSTRHPSTCWLPGLQLRQSWASTPRPAVPSCLPRQRLVFLKTHKSGSSSVLSLLHRYGDRHGLRFALPARYQFGYPKLFQASRVKGYHPQGGGTQPPFHILCHHMRFNLKEVLQVMPSDSFFFSIVRDPAALARSAFSYYKSTSSAFRKSPSLAAFLDNPRAFYQPGAHPNPPQLPSGVGARAHTLDPNALFHPVPTVADGHSQTSSSASLDLGSSSFIQWNLAWLDSVFDLVLVAEYFDDAVGNGGLTAEDRQLSARARAWNNLDWALYVHFNRSLWARIKQYGQSRLDSAVAALRARREALAKHCLVGGEALDPKYITDRRFRPFQFGSGKVLGYVLRSGLSLQDQEECGRLATPELQYKDKLDAKQFPPAVSVPLKTSRLPSP